MIYPILLVVHNAVRWLVLGSLLAALISSYSGWLCPRPYRPADQAIRTVTTSILHTQLLIGFYLYFISPIVTYYWRFPPTPANPPNFAFSD